MTAIHIIAGCAARKAVTPDSRHCLRSVPHKRVEKRAAEWCARLSTAKATHTALDLYQGEYWQIIRGLAVRDPALLWVASAGYGLIAAHRPVASYSATFASGQPDSVVRYDVDHTPASVWWALIRRLSSTSPDVQRDDLVVVVASAPYLSAASEDLLQIRRRLSKREQLIVFSSFMGHGDSEWINEHRVCLPANARLRLGGTVGTVNARACAAYFRDRMIGHPASEVERVLRKKYAGQQIEPLRREFVSDDVVCSWIKQESRKTSLSCSAALRRFRDSGFACEQSRFARLFRTVAESIGG